ncbi:septum formation family protein [Sinomonas sp. P10A9]|uniref:Septum formation family protein n=1 Tax=Sinomonas puerhi TaxID=3238584 RepID=A0AB39L177_9MICC
MITALVAVGLVIWGISAFASAGRPKTAVESTAYAKGDCFADFDAAANSGDKVTCTDPHSAQLVGVENAGDAEAYPGRDALEQRASQLCKAPNIVLPGDTSNLKQRSAYPSQDGWKGGDRRMDCYILSTNGNTLTASFLH